jgi:hypothetical protein
MKKIIFLLFVCVSMLKFSTQALTVPVVGDPMAKENAYRQKVEMLKKIASMNVKEFEAFTGKHMNVIDRALFKIEQRKLKNAIDSEGNITNKKLDKYLKSSSDHSTGFHLGGFALGFFLGLIGVLLAYVAFNDDNKSNRIKWSWIGTAVVVVLNIIIIVAIL